MRPWLLAIVALSCAGCAAIQDDCTLDNPAGRTPSQRIVGDLLVAPIAVPACLLVGIGETQMAAAPIYAPSPSSPSPYAASQPFNVQGLGGSGAYAITPGPTTCIPLNDANRSVDCR